MTKVDVLLGLQWGDEGKGKVVDVLTPEYEAVARFQGGPNAGHTLEFDGKKYVLRSIPSGVFQTRSVNIIGNGVVLDPVLFRKEAEELASSGVDLRKVLKISKRAHLILPTHRLLDAANEMAKGERKIGTTGKGIGPTYTDKISRNGVRVGDLLCDFPKKFEAAIARHNAMLAAAGADPVSRKMIDEWLEAAEYLRTFDLIDSDYYINSLLAEDKSLLAEGAQGTMLDVDFGSYPFVTSSNTITAGACIGLGVPPRAIGEVYGIFKAYCTRVGAGPFPTELFDATGKEIRDKGHEYGAVTGRERRCGWVDLVALRFAVMINGVTRLIMMKSDVLDGFKTIKACTAYEINGKVTEYFPFNAEEVNITPIYKELPGWEKPLAGVTDAAEFPKEFTDYIAFLEEYLKVPIYIVSTGPDRMETIKLRPL